MSYPDNWKEIADAVKSEAEWKCIRCRHRHDPESGHTLTVHHLDGVKSNCRWWNLVALCQRCHLCIQGKVKMNRIWMFEHSEWFRPYVAGFYAFHYGLPDERATVATMVDDLISLGSGRISREDIQKAA